MNSQNNVNEKVVSIKFDATFSLIGTDLSTFYIIYNIC